MLSLSFALNLAQNGVLELSRRDHSGQVDRTTFRAHYEDLTLAEPPKKELAEVVCGKHRGTKGVVQSLTGRDAVVSVDGESVLFKMAHLGWINTARR